MDLDLIPEPRQIRRMAGQCRLPSAGTIGIRSPEWVCAAGEAQREWPAWRVTAAAPGLRDGIEIRGAADLKPEGYRLSVQPGGVLIEAQSECGSLHAVRTLAQLRRQFAGRPLPCLAITDGPDYPARGVYYDVARGRVPRRERLVELAQELARYKVNQLQLYVEHTFRFRRYPRIGQGASPLTADDIVALDGACRAARIELVPSLASFGHMARVLSLREFRPLAEDWGVGRYTDPESHRLPAWARRKGWSLSPANPATYEFLENLFAEYLPLFSSKQFNVCCDETWDLGYGQSRELCARRGKGRVYLDHILRLRELAARHGKRIQFWGDIIRRYPALIPEIPDDVTVLEWGYSHDEDTRRLAPFRDAGVPYYVCPGTSGWVSLFPRLPEAMANIRRYAQAGLEYGACGLLNTDWGDGGHYNFMELSWHGYLFGAEQSWNRRANHRSFTGRFARGFLRSENPDLPAAIEELGQVAHLGLPGYYQSIWQHVFFAAPDDPVFRLFRPRASVACAGRIRKIPVDWSARLGGETIERLGRARRVLAGEIGKRGVDPNGVLPCWVFAADAMVHAARKLRAFGAGGRDTARVRRELRLEAGRLLRRFENLWAARNRPSEIRVTRARYRRAAGSLR